VSPGSLREQEAYLLGSVEAPAVVGALLAAFADPELALDRAFANEAAASVLAMANGYRLTTGGEGPGGGAALRYLRGPARSAATLPAWHRRRGAARAWGPIALLWPPGLSSGHVGCLSCHRPPSCVPP